MKNLLKEKIRKGEVGLGVLIQEPAITLVEILGIVGIDYINMDCQHSPMTLETVMNIVRAAELRGITALARVPELDTETILRFLDVGVKGIIVADMDNAEVARKAVRAVKYPPVGERGLSSVRANDFGLRESLAASVKSANEETMVIGVVESQEGVENIEEILATDGLDAIIIGTTDLSKALGVPGQRNAPVVQEAVAKIKAAAKKSGKVLAGTVRKGEVPQQYIQDGYGMVSTSLNQIVSSAAQQFVKNARG